MRTVRWGLCCAVLYTVYTVHITVGSESVVNNEGTSVKIISGIKVGLVERLGLLVESSRTSRKTRITCVIK